MPSSFGLGLGAAAMAVWHRAFGVNSEVWTAWGTWVGSLGTIALGLIGAYFVHRQNKILHKQNEILERQTAQLESQRELNEVLIKSELESRAAEDTERTLYRIFDTSISGADEVAEAVQRLLDKGHPRPELRRMFLGLYKRHGYAEPHSNPIDIAYDTLSRRKVIAILEQGPNSRPPT